MCGIFGMTGPSVDTAAAEHALKMLAHRGPDQSNSSYDGNVYLGHRRLSINDLSDRGKQPLSNEDGTILVIANGEIYNFAQLRKELDSNYNFYSSSDSEVLLHGYAEWGIEGLLDKIDGMFAIAIYDKRLQRLYLVRDRVGIKPLYYAVRPDGIGWSSEINALTSYLGEGNLSVDYSALYDFLSYLYIPCPKTKYKEINKLEPAHYLEVDLLYNTVKKKCYWELPVDECADSADSAGAKISLLMRHSVQEQLVADVPVGLFLSGGLDSSIVTIVASQLQKNIDAFTISFKDLSHDESRFASVVASSCGVTHYVSPFSFSDFDAPVQTIRNLYGEPFGDTSCFPTLAVSMQAVAKCKVVLTGDGGDEVFGGYKWYDLFHRLIKIRRFVPELIQKAIRYLASKSTGSRRLQTGAIVFSRDELELYTKILGGMTKKEKQSYRLKWGIPDAYDDYWYFRKHYRTDLKVHKRLRYLDFHTYLHDDILTKVDRASMAVSLECRVPFLSRNLVEYAFSLQSDVVSVSGGLKRILKSTYEKELPNTITQRDKKGFSVPVREWATIFPGDAKKPEKILSAFMRKE